MAKHIVDRAGFLLLGTTADPDSLFDGAQVKHATLTLNSRTATAQAIGDDYTEEAVVGKSYELSGTAYLADTAGRQLFAVGDTCQATYYSQHATSGVLDQVLFQGPVVVTKVSDTQTQGDYETQDITLHSTGTPTVPPYAA